MKEKYEFKPRRAVRLQPGEEREPPAMRPYDHDAVEASLAEFDVFYEHAEISYQRTGNPLYAWAAFCGVMMTGRKPRRWAAAVVLGAMERLVDLPQGDGDDILKALGLKTPPGKRSYVRQYADDQAAVRAALRQRKSEGDHARAPRGRRLLDTVGAEYPKPKKRKEPV